MSDLTLICANCSNEFVFSEGEQAFYANKALETPKYCPICRAIKAQERKIPPRPKADPPLAENPTSKSKNTHI